MADLLRWSTVVAFFAAVAWSIAWLWHVLAVGAGYKAKILCSTIFGVGRSIDPRRADEVSADSYWPLRLFGARVDTVHRSVTVSFLGLQSRTAIHRPQFGSTLSPPHALALRDLASATTV